MLNQLKLLVYTRELCFTFINAAQTTVNSTKVSRKAGKGQSHK